MAALDYLERYYDSGMSLPRYENREAIERAEEQRIARTLAVVVVAGSMPRRIGAASDEELRADKQTARRLSHALQQSLRGWSSRPIFEIVTLDDKVRRDGATVEWDHLVESHLSIVKSRQRVVATWAIRKKENRWGRSAIVRLENELKWVSYAGRE
jgi:hypothetical protein